MNEAAIEKKDQERMSPVKQGERIQILDILRGFAVFGILLVNITGFAAPVFWPGYSAPELSGIDELATKLVQLLAESKFYTIFAFLFGLGFSIQLSRAEAKGRDIRSFYPRRLWILFGAGILHAILLWTGDILRIYALLGFALLAFRKRSNRTLIIWAGVFFALSFALLTLVDGQSGAEASGIPYDFISMARRVYQGSSYLDVVLLQTVASPVIFIILSLTQGPSVMALFLLGLLAGRLRIFEQLPRYRKAAGLVLAGGMLAGLAANSLFAFGEAPWLRSLGITLGAPVLAAAYIAGLCLLSQNQAGARLLAPLGQVGRMALSNYVLQSLVCSVLFYGFGFGLYERVGAAVLVAITLAIYLAQIPLSAWWLRRFNFGPLEWVWRSLTYGKRQPMRKEKGFEGPKGELPAAN